MQGIPEKKEVFLVSFWNTVENFFFFIEIRIDELDKNKSEWQKREPDRFALKDRAQIRGDHSAKRENSQHSQMKQGPRTDALVFSVFIRFDDMDP